MPVKSANKRKSHSMLSIVSLNNSRMEWNEEVARPCATQTLPNGSVLLLFLFCFALFSPMKHNIVVCFTFLLCFPHPGSLIVDNYTGCGLIS